MRGIVSRWEEEEKEEEDADDEGMEVGNRFSDLGSDGVHERGKN